MNRKLVLCGLLALPGFTPGQSAAPPAPIELRDGGRTLIRAGQSLSLPGAARAVHVIRDDVLLIEEGDRFRFIVEKPANGGVAALLRTLPRQSREGSFVPASRDGYLVFVSGTAREEIDLRALLAGTFRGTYSVKGAAPARVWEPPATPITTLFWKSLHPPGYVGPGHGSRQEIFAAFGVPRPSESIEEYEPFDCEFPPHVTQENRRQVWVPTRTQVYEHTLRDRQGYTLVFFTALESGDITYASEPEATAGGCEASFLRTRHNGAQSLDPDQPLRYRDQYRVRVELRDLGVPAAGVLVRIFERRDGGGRTCGAQSIDGRQDIGSDDGMTLADGSYVWKRVFRDQRSRGTRDYFVDNSVSATVCIRLDGTWRPLWYSPREYRTWGVRCDLALPEARRCSRIS